MPVIPLSQDEKQIRTPRPQAARPIDVASGQEGVRRFGAEINKAMGVLGEGALRYGEKASWMKDAHDRNVAEREFNEKVSLLNETYNKLYMEQKRDYEPKFIAEKKLAKDTYEAKINKIGNFQIREDSKRNISSFNQRDAANFDYESYQNETNIQEKEMGQALLASNNRRLESVNPAQTVESMAMMAESSFPHDEQIIRQFYQGRKGMPKEVVDQIVKDYRSKSIIAMAARYTQQTMALDPYTGYKTEEGLLNWAVENNYLNPTEAIEAKRAMQTQRLDLAVKMHPGDFVRADGTYDMRMARSIAKDLRPDELWHAVAEASKGTGSGKGSGANELIQRIGNGMYDDLLNQAMMAGYMDIVPEAYQNEFFANNKQTSRDYVVGLSKAKQDQKQYILDGLNLLSQANALENGFVAINPNTMKAEKTIGKNEVAKYQQKGYYITKPSNLDNIISFKNNLMAQLANKYQNGDLDRMLRPTGLFGKKTQNTVKDTLLINGLRRDLEHLGVGKEQTKKKWWESEEKYYKRLAEKGTPVVPRMIAFNSLVSNKFTALSKAQDLLGFDSDALAKDGMNIAYHPISGYDKEGNPIRDMQQPAVTPAQAFAYYEAIENADTLGPEFMRFAAEMEQNRAGLQESEKIRQFAHSSLYKEFTQNETDPYKNFQRENIVYGGWENPIIVNKNEQQFVPMHAYDLPDNYDERKQTNGKKGQAAIAKDWANTSDVAMSEEAAAKASPFSSPSKPKESAFPKKEESYFNNEKDFSKEVKRQTKQYFNDIEGTFAMGRLKTFDELAAEHKVVTEDDYNAYLYRNTTYNGTAEAIKKYDLNLGDSPRMFLVNSPTIQKALESQSNNALIDAPIPLEYRNINVDDMAKDSSEWKGISSVKEQDNGKYVPIKEGEKVVFFTDNGEAFVLTPFGGIERIETTPGVFATMLQTAKENGNVFPKGQYMREGSYRTYVSAPPISQQKYAAEYEANNPIPFDFR